MNDSIEQTLKGWRPTPPSPGLRSRIFASEAVHEPAPERTGFDITAWMRWLVPVMGCFLILTASVAEPETQARLEPGSVSLSGEKFAYSAMASANRELNQKNTVPVTSMERSFGQRSNLQVDSFAGSETNTLSK